jgi:sugar phosphate isomerase/epimerase
MARLAISELTTLRWSFEEDVEHYQAAGVTAIGVWRQKLTDVGEAQGAKLLADAGLAVSSLQWAGGFTGSNGLSYEDGLVDARQAIYTAERLRAPCLIIHSGARGVHIANHARRLFCQALEKLLPIAEERGVTLALEPMSGPSGGEFTFVNCLDESLELIDEIESPALGIALDTYHWAHEPLLFERLTELAPRLALVQLADARQPPWGEENRCRLGDGKLPLRRLLRELRAAGYDGDYEIELIGEEIGAANYGEVLSHSVRTFHEWMSELEPIAATAPSLSRTATRSLSRTGP